MTKIPYQAEIESDVQTFEEGDRDWFTTVTAVLEKEDFAKFDAQARRYYPSKASHAVKVAHLNKFFACSSWSYED